MTRKHLALIADAIAAEHAAATTFAEQQAVVRVAMRLANSLATANPRFDADKFMDACLGY